MNPHDDADKRPHTLACTCGWNTHQIGVAMTVEIANVHERLKKGYHRVTVVEGYRTVTGKLEWRCA